MMRTSSSYSTLATAALALLAAAFAGCSQEPATNEPAAGEASSFGADVGADATGEAIPGLDVRIIEEGSGPAIAPGATAVVHYTGWLYDESAEDKRGQKFDSSVDRGQHFSFPLGAGRVIRGWDAGVAGMRVGEVRELTIAPELAYGERGAGNVIPPGATLVFEVELAGIEGGANR